MKLKKQPQLNRKKNTDFYRQNMATSVVKGTMYSLVNDSVNDTILTVTNRLLQQSDTTLKSNTKNDLINISKAVKFSKEVNANARSYYMKSSTYIKSGALPIARREVSKVTDAIDCNECNLLQSKMQHYNSRIVDIHKQIDEFAKDPNIQHESPPTQSPGVSTGSPMLPTGLNTVEATSQSTYNNTTIASVLTNNPPAINRITRSAPYYLSNSSWSHITPTFSMPLPETGDQYTPLETVTHLIKLCSQVMSIILDLPKDQNNNYQIKAVSKNTLVKIMIYKKYVPRTRARIYKLLSMYKLNGSLVYDSWQEFKRKGPKCHLSDKSYNALKAKYGVETVGGAAVSKIALRKELDQLIRNDYEEEKKMTYPHRTIPLETMQRYVNSITASEEFNIHRSVATKTESRAIAEFSIRSTITYLLVVMTTHFFRADPHPYSMPLKQLQSNPTYQLINQINETVLGIDQLNGKENDVAPLTLVAVCPS